MFKRISLHLFLLLKIVVYSYAQNNDAIKITEARIAFEKYNDCKNALAALNEVSESGKKLSLFELYAGKINDCLKDFDKAIYYYEQYLATYPNATDIVQRVAELRYEKRKKASQFDLAGTWYIKGSPEMIRKVYQSGNTIRISDPKTPGNKGLDFQGSLQPSGVYKGGSYWYFKKINVAARNHSCLGNKCVFQNMEYREADDEFYKQTYDDVLTISEDGNTITMKYSVPFVASNGKTIDFEGRNDNRCVCELEWEIQYLVYLRAEQ